MKRYRYGNPSSQTVLQKARPYILLFVGWNLAGAMFWKFVNSGAEKKDSEWFSKPDVDRIARLTGNAPDDAQKYTFSFNKKEEK